MVLVALVALVAPGCTTTTPTNTPEAPSSAPSGPAADGEPMRLVVDTDMAPDDVTAIASLIRDPALELLAITVAGTGEAHCQGGMFVARSIVTQLRDAPVPVACGRDSPMGDAQPFPDAWRAGADTGNGLTLISPSFAPDPRLAEQVIVDLANAEAAAGRRLTILTLGTLTNVATAVELDPTLPERVTLMSMLGAIAVPGNVTPDVVGGSGPAVAEWNAHADPTAVRVVLEAGFDWTLIPLDATNSVPLTEDLYVDLESDHAAGPADLVFELWSRNSSMRSSGFYLWDPLAAAALLDRSIVETREMTVRVIEGAGLDGGQLVEDASGNTVTVATSADRDAFEASLLARLRLGGPRAAGFDPVATLSVSAGEACEVVIDPVPTPSGLLRIEATNTGEAFMTMFVFELGSVAWADIEAFVADPPGARRSPPPVVPVADVVVEASSSATGYGEAPAGELGVACVTPNPTQDDPDEFRAILAGPFPIGP